MTPIATSPLYPPFLGALVAFSQLTRAGAPSTGNEAATEGVPVGYSSHFATAGQITLHYVEGGSGNVVVLLHGWPETWRAWRKVMPLLAVNYRVIAVDLPGLGESDASPSGYDKRTLARHVHALLAVLGHRRVALVGHDLGAAVAYAYAKQFPEEVNKLVVMDDPIPGLKDWNDVRSKWPRWHFAFHSLPDLPEQLVTGREYTYLSWFYRNAYQKAAISDEDIRLYVAAYSKPASLHAGFEYYRAFEQDAADNSNDHAPLDMPVLALGGDHSPWRTYLYEQLQGNAISLEGAVVPECGHFIPEEQPKWLAEHVRLFLDPTPPLNTRYLIGGW
jgi:pimeloyl-ACP methyl ester carboxylesterase